ncbi:unnamed protein product, partial [Prorocentrum cordatum]
GSGDDEVEWLRDEAEELRLKLEALRAADSRDQLRAACAGAAPGCGAAEAPALAGFATPPHAARRSSLFGDALPAFRRQVSDASDATRTSGDGTPSARAPPAGDDEDLAARRPSAARRHALGEEAADAQVVVDEAHCVSRPTLGADGSDPAQPSRPPRGGGAEGPRAPRAARSAESAAARRLRVVEATLRHREKIFEEQMEAQDRKLSAASAALRKSRSQVQSVTAQLGLKELEGRRLEAQVMQLRGLLVEKERRLQEALDEVQLLRVARPAGPATAGPRPGGEVVKGDLAPAEDTEA